jgi:hypothetical protein
MRLIEVFAIILILLLPQTVLALNKDISIENIDEAIEIAKDKDNFKTICNEWVIIDNYQTLEGVLIISPFFNVITTSRDYLRKYIQPSIKNIREQLSNCFDRIYFNITARGSDSEFLRDSHIVIRYKKNNSSVIIQPENVTIGSPIYSMEHIYTNTAYSVFDLNKVPNQVIELILIFKNGIEKVYNIDLKKMR